MKELKKFHLRPEQELSDEEMKQISLNAATVYYANCNTNAQYHSHCNINMPCMGIKKIGDTLYNYIPGYCKFEYFVQQDANESCFCKYWEGYYKG